MTLYMPPLQKKKRVPSRYNPDSFRVISQDAETTHPKYNPVPDYRPPTPERERTGVILPDIYNRNTQVMPKTQPDFRANKPHPGSCGFLRHNVRGLNEPICSVFTRDTHVEQNQWWPSRTSNDPLDEPPKTKDTTYRGDFMKDEYGDLHRTTRHESNLNREAALGAEAARKLATYELRKVPVNFLRNKDGSQRVYKETKSYEHDYNCRSATNYPIRGRRVGSFVYDEMNPKTTKKFIDQHSRLLDQEAVYRKHLESNTTSTSSSSSQSLPGGGSQSSSSQGTGTPPRGGSEVPPSVPPQQDQGGAPMLPSAQVNGQGGVPMLPSAQENGQVGAPATVEENTASSPPARVASAPAPAEVTPSLPPAKEPSTNKTVTFDMSQNES